MLGYLFAIIVQEILLSWLRAPTRQKPQITRIGALPFYMTGQSRAPGGSDQICNNDVAKR